MRQVTWRNAFNTGRCNLDDIIFWEVDVELNLERWTIQICMTFSLFPKHKDILKNVDEQPIDKTTFFKISPFVF